MTDRIPPQAIEAEQSILGSMLQNTEACNSALTLLRPDDFYLPRHRKIFVAIAELIDEGDAIDLLTVPNRLDRRGELVGIGGRRYLMDLTDSVVNFDNIENHCQIVKQAACKNRLINDCSQLINRAYDPTVSRDELVAEAEQKVLDIANDSITGGSLPIKVVAKEVLARAEHAWEHGPSGIVTGHIDLDKVLIGIEDTDYVVIGARPEVGKTALLLTLAENWAQGGKRVQIFTLEMSRGQLVNRIIAGVAQVDSKIYRQYRNGIADSQKYRDAELVVEKLPIFIDETPGLSILDIKVRARQAKLRDKVDVILVDYLQLLRAPNPESRTMEITTISQGLRNLAKELHTPVIVASQLNRNMELRGKDARPILSDLRDSGSIEQDACIIIFIHRKKKDKTAELIVAKNREGPTGTVNVSFIPEYSRFELLARGESEDGLPF